MREDPMNRFLKPCIAPTLILVMAGAYLMPAFLISRMVDQVQRLSDRELASSSEHEQAVQKMLGQLLKEKTKILAVRAELDLAWEAMAQGGKLTEDLHSQYLSNLANLLTKLSCLDSEVRELQRSLSDMQGMPASERRIAEYNLQTSVKVIALYGTLGEGWGSGNVIRVHGTETYVITAAHVVDSVDPNLPGTPADKIKPIVTPSVSVRYYDFKTNAVQTYAATVVKFDKDADLALLKISGWTCNYVAKVMPSAMSGTLRLMDSVYVVGCPLGTSPRVSRGEITALAHAEPGHIQSNCHIIFGNSGGGLFRGEHLIGVASTVMVTGRQAVTHLGSFVNGDLIRAFLTGTDCVVE